MKRFLGKADDASELDSLKDLPIFGAGTHDELDMNPSISAPSMTTEHLGVETSLFSSRSRLTKQLLQISGNVRRKGTQGFGQPLPILETDEDREQSPDIVAAHLHQLWLDVAFTLGQYNNAVVNLSTCVITVMEYLKDFVAVLDKLPHEWSFSAYDNSDVRRILKTYLHFYDNLLKDDAYIKLKLLLSKSFNEFAHSLKSSQRRQPVVMAKPQLYAIGCNDGRALPNQAEIGRIVERMAGSSYVLKEQNGLFIAPVARGIGKDMNVLCLYFGQPSILVHHLRIFGSVTELYDDVHVLVAKNQIELALAAVAQPPVLEPPKPSHVFKLPFRTPREGDAPAMSLSISVESAVRVSGTLGGFIYPKIDPQKQPHFRLYANSTFALLCGHVCLDKRDSAEYPHVSLPLLVLISLYKQALEAQYEKEGLVASVAYALVLAQLEAKFPAREVQLYDPRSKVERTERRNFPRHRFGQIIWGERTLVAARSTRDGKKLEEKRLSDLAVVKVNRHLRNSANFLGDDIALNEYDPLLMFENLYVRRVVALNRHAKLLSPENVNEVDSVVTTSLRDSRGPYINNGLPVFKYGSTTKFTCGRLNGIKLVYWLDGAVHSLEFVVNLTESTTAFAAGGDSGLWILTKLENLRSAEKGLGVVGMLHLYDGEFRQFGLFTPMTEILERLEEVTKIQWGVVGVPEKDPAEEASESDGSFSDGEYESGLEEQNPDID